MKEEVSKEKRKVNTHKNDQWFTLKGKSLPLKETVSCNIPLRGKSIPLFSRSVIPETMLSPIKGYGSKKRISLLTSDNIIGINPIDYTLNTKYNAHSRHCYTNNIDNDNIDIDEYEEERELVDLLEGKGKKVGNYKDLNLIKNLQQKNKQPKCDIIQEVDEEKYKQINEENNANTLQNNHYFSTKLKKPVMSYTIISSTNINSNISSKGLLTKCDDINNDKDSHNTFNSNFQTESSSTRSISTNGSKVSPQTLTLDNNQNILPIIKNTNISSLQQGNFIARSTMVSNTNETVLNKLKLKMTTINPTDAKDICYYKEMGKRNHLLTAPISQIQNNPLLSSKQIPISIRDKIIEEENERNEMKNWLHLNNTRQIVNISQRRKQAGTPIKVFSKIKPVLESN